MPALPLVALLLSLPAIAQVAQPVPAPEEKKVCRRMEPATGSIMGGKRVCRTKAEWSEIDAQNQANADRALSQRRSRGPGSGS